MAKRPRITIDCDRELAFAAKLAALKSGDISVSQLCIPILERELRKKFPECFVDAKKYMQQKDPKE